MAQSPSLKVSSDGFIQASPFFVNFLDKTYYVAQPRQLLLHMGVRNAVNGMGAPYILYGGAAGGGKTEGLLWSIFQITNDPRFKNLKIGVFRKTFPEIEKYFILRGLEKFPNPENKEFALYKYRAKDHSMHFHLTGATVWFNYCESDLDVLAYQGAEFDVIVIDELTHHTEYVFKYLMTRNRTSNPQFHPCFIASTNPGGVGHAWVKRLWVDKDDYSDEERLSFEKGIWRDRSQAETAKDYLFIQSKVWDNRILVQNNPKYVQKLRSMPEMDRRALLEGDWNIFAGQYFRELRTEIQGFDPLTFGLIPDEWMHFIAFDYGFFPHPASVGWYAVDEAGTIYRYKELLVQRHTFSELAKLIIKNSTPAERRAIEYLVGSHEIHAKRGNGEGKSGAEELQDVFDAEPSTKGWVVLRADNDRINGWYQTREAFKPYQGPNGPTARFRCATTCVNFWKQMPQLQHDPNKAEDVFKQGVPEDGKLWQGDDVGDEVRYAIMSRFSKPKDTGKKKPQRDRYGAPVKRDDRLAALHQLAKRNLPKPEWKGLRKPPQ